MYIQTARGSSYYHASQSIFYPICSTRDVLRGLIQCTKSSLTVNSVLHIKKKLQLAPSRVAKHFIIIVRPPQRFTKSRLQILTRARNQNNLNFSIKIHSFHIFKGTIDILKVTLSTPLLADIDACWFMSNM